MRERLSDHGGLAGLVALLVLIGVLAGATWVVIILVLMAVLFLHELGHYLTARMTGMKVSEFFIGFGPARLVVPPGRDRIRHQGRLVGRLRPNRGNEQPRGGGAAR